MRDGPLRSVLKLVALLRFAFDTAVTRGIRRLRGEPAFLLQGTCLRCGGCCQTPMVQLGSFLYFLPTWRWLVITWHRLVNGFTFLASDRPSRTLIFACIHWDPQTRLCDSYRTRPGMCRDYPRPLLFTTDPRLLDSCGFVAIARRRDRLRQALAAAELSPALRAELEHRLHVNEPEAGR